MNAGQDGCQQLFAETRLIQPVEVMQSSQYLEKAGASFYNSGVGAGLKRKMSPARNVNISIVKSK